MEKQDEKLYPILYQELKTQVTDRGHFMHYKKVDTGKYEFTTGNKDNCVMIRDKSVLCIESIFQNSSTLEMFVNGRKFMESTTFFNSPCSSKLFYIQQMQNISNATYTANINDIEAKCIKFPYKDDFIILPLVHTQ